jgi:hypothetical protein
MQERYHALLAVHGVVWVQARLSCKPLALEVKRDEFHPAVCVAAKTSCLAVQACDNGQCTEAITRACNTLKLDIAGWSTEPQPTVPAAQEHRRYPTQTAQSFIMRFEPLQSLHLCQARRCGYATSKTSRDLSDVSVNH